MRSISCITILFAIFLSPQRPSEQDAATPNAEAMLRELSQELSSLSTISYQYRRELNYASESYNKILEAGIYLAFDPTQQPIGFLYQAQRPEGFEIFNGSEIVRGVTSTHTLQMTPTHTIEALRDNSLLFNSFVTLRAALPTLLDDNTIAKSVGSCTAALCTVDIKLPRATLTAIGTLSPIQLQRDITYRITIDRNTMLPTEVRQTNSANSDFTDVQFSNVNLNPAKPPATSWRYSSYTGYKLTPPANAPKPLAVGSIAPSWTLASLADPATKLDLATLLKQRDTKLLLLEFWISHCGHSIDAVPALNNIARKYKDSLKVIAINPDDSPATMQLFQKNFSPTYPLLSDSAGISRQYGVSAPYRLPRQPRRQDHLCR